MAYKIIQLTALFKEPRVDAEILGALLPDDIVQEAGEETPDWVKVRHQPVPDPGWLQKAHAQKVEVPRPSVDRCDFVRTCILAERAFNALATTPPWFAYADFIVARAIIDTNIVNAGAKLPGSNGVGPLQVSSEEWQKFLSTTIATDEGFNESDRDHATAQVFGATHTMVADAKAISDLKNKKDKDSGKRTEQQIKDDPYVPTYLDIFHSHLTRSPAAAVAILEAVVEAKSQMLATVLAGLLPAESIGKLFTGRSGFKDVQQPEKVGEFVDQTRGVLNKTLNDAFESVKDCAPEELLVVKQGDAPWLDIAEKEAKDRVTADDPAFKARILNYFKATDHPPVNQIVSWCGAFVAHCMKESGNDVVAASIPKGAAAAINWKNWGTALPLASTDVPKGAVVVLTPDGGTNHVGFFDEFIDGENVRLLGGNQTRAVRRTPFKRSSIAAIQWLDLAPTNVKLQGDANPSNKKISDDAFSLIIEFEVSSEAVYRKKFHRPEWPGHSSGVTIGIGYDVGQTKASVFESDWRGVIPDAMVDALRTRAIGITGPEAKPIAASLQATVDIPWEEALQVHTDKVIPRWVGLAESVFRNTGDLNDDCLGALVSLIYNRGTSFENKPSRKEMIEVRDAMAAKQFNRIPGLIRDMKRLWPDSNGLKRRRDSEATFFEKGLAKMGRG